MRRTVGGCTFELETSTTDGGGVQLSNSPISSDPMLCFTPGSRVWYLHIAYRNSYRACGRKELFLSKYGRLGWSIDLLWRGASERVPYEVFNAEDNTPTPSDEFQSRFSPNHALSGGVGGRAHTTIMVALEISCWRICPKTHRSGCTRSPLSDKPVLKLGRGGVLSSVLCVEQMLSSLAAARALYRHSFADIFGRA